MEYYLTAATDLDFDFVYHLKKTAYKTYIEQTWGWDELFQIKFHKENFSARNTKIIWADAEPVGSVDIKEEESSVFISGLYLLPQYQSKGVGTRILLSLIESSGAVAKRVELEVLKVNERAIQLYKRLGFLMEDRDDKKYFMYHPLQVEIVPFKPEYAADFADLNKTWLQKYFVVEPVDAKMLADPKHFFVDKGGHLFFAKIGEKIVGTFALLKVSDGVFELSKMAVSEAHQGNKIGNKLLEYCLSVAKELAAKKIILYSNTKLENAIYLYRKYGFEEVPLDKAEYKRANIKMEIDIK